MSQELTIEKARIFRILHRENLAWALDNGFHCKNSEVADPKYVAIGNAELIDKRSHRVVKVAPGGTLSDYVPFYFTPFSPMMYNIKTGWGGITKRDNKDIVIAVSSLHKVSAAKVNFLFTDRHAYLEAAQYASDLKHLDRIDWPLLQRRDFSRDGNDPGKVERYQAEALIHKHMPIAALSGIVCYNDSVASALNAEIAKRELGLQVAVKPQWYFS